VLLLLLRHLTALLLTVLYVAPYRCRHLLTRSLPRLAHAAKGLLMLRLLLVVQVLSLLLAMAVAAAAVAADDDPADGVAASDRHQRRRWRYCVAVATAEAATWATAGTYRSVAARTVEARTARGSEMGY
jgi:hypothetical protein